MLLLIAVIGVLAIQLCFVIKKEIYAMKVLAIDLSVSGRQARSAFDLIKWIAQTDCLTTNRWQKKQKTKLNFLSPENV